MVCLIEEDAAALSALLLLCPPSYAVPPIAVKSQTVQVHRSKTAKKCVR
jgi:hypothetical protein